MKRSERGDHSEDRVNINVKHVPRYVIKCVFKARRAPVMKPIEQREATVADMATAEAAPAAMPIW